MKRFSIIASELILGGLVAILSVLVALAAYQSTLYDGVSGDLNLEGQKLLTDSNAEYLEANQFVIYDYSMYDGWWINSGVNDENSEYYQSSFSEELTLSMERPDGPFDDEYYAAMYIEPSSKYDEALLSFEEAQSVGDKAEKLQLVVLIFAVGLALSAYGSLLAAESKMRLLFSLGSIFALIFGLFNYFVTIL